MRNFSDLQLLLLIPFQICLKTEVSGGPSRPHIVLQTFGGMSVIDIPNDLPVATSKTCKALALPDSLREKFVTTVNRSPEVPEVDRYVRPSCVSLVSTPSGNRERISFLPIGTSFWKTSRAWASSKRAPSLTLSRANPACSKRHLRNTVSIARLSKLASLSPRPPPLDLETRDLEP